MQMQTTGWARVKPPGAYSLRRGAWYPVLEDNGDGSEVVLDLNHRTVVIPRANLQLRSDRPTCFSIVARRPEDPNPVRGTQQDLGLQYAVCPLSHTRVRLAGHPEVLECPKCGYQFPIEWDDVC